MKLSWTLPEYWYPALHSLLDTGSCASQPSPISLLCLFIGLWRRTCCPQGIISPIDLWFIARNLSIYWDLQTMLEIRGPTQLGMHRHPWRMRESAIWIFIDRLCPKAEVVMSPHPPALSWWWNRFPLLAGNYNNCTLDDGSNVSWIKREIIDVLPTFWSPTKTTLNLFIFGIGLNFKLLIISPFFISFSYTLFYLWNQKIQINKKNII